MIGTITNIILDPIMILGMNMGVQGAAIATVIGNACACIYYIMYFQRKKTTLLSISLKDFSAGNKIGTSVFAIGTPGALGNLLMSVSNIFMNLLLVSYGDNAIAAMGVCMKVGMIVVMLQIGLASGILPILSFNYGAGKIDRLKETIKKSGIICFGLGVCLTLACFLACNPGVVFTQTQIFEAVWNMESDSCHSSVTNVIYNLRKKIKPDSKNPTYIKTVLGVGYKFSG